MADNSITLGHALAILEAELNSVNSLPKADLSENEQKYLQKLRNRTKVISDDCRIAEILHSTFNKCCSGRACITDNEDFFLAYLLNSLSNENSINECLQVMENINSCFVCFEAFWPVIRDYHDMVLELYEKVKMEKA